MCNYSQSRLLDVRSSSWNQKPAMSSECLLQNLRPVYGLIYITSCQIPHVVQHSGQVLRRPMPKWALLLINNGTQTIVSLLLLLGIADAHKALLMYFWVVIIIGKIAGKIMPYNWGIMLLNGKGELKLLIS